MTENPFTKKHDIVYFKMTKIEKTLKVFDASFVAVGVCLPHVARLFGFRNLMEPTHGAYMIGSNGKTYHSNLEKYNKQPLAVLA